MTGTELAQQLINAVMTGSVYALLALGLGVVFGVLRMINFAHGELVVLGGFAMWATVGWGWPLPLVALATLVVPVVAAVLLELVAFRPLRGRDPVATLLTSFALSFLVQNLLALGGSARAQAIPLPAWVGRVVTLGGVQTPLLSVVITTVTVLALVAVSVFLRISRPGMAVRAAADDLAALGLTGVRVDTVVRCTFALSGLLAGLAALALFARSGSVSPTSGVVPGLVAFVAIAVGGEGSLRGAVLGGYSLGFVQVLLQALLPVEALPFRDAVVYLAVAVCLVVRPQGLVSLLARSTDRAVARAT